MQSHDTLYWCASSLGLRLTPVHHLVRCLLPWNGVHVLIIKRSATVLHEHLPLILPGIFQSCLHLHFWLTC